MLQIPFVLMSTHDLRGDLTDVSIQTKALFALLNQRKGWTAGMRKADIMNSFRAVLLC